MNALARILAWTLAVALVALPVVILFLYLQKYLVSGLTAGGVKG